MQLQNEDGQVASTVYLPSVKENGLLAVKTPQGSIDAWHPLARIDKR